MPSSKKKRGRDNKQRKKNSTSSIREVPQQDTDTQAKYARIFNKTIRNVPPSHVIERVRQGMGLTTQLISNFLAWQDEGGFITTVHHQYLQKLIDEGLISVVLGLLCRCESEVFEDVIETDGICGVSVGNAVFTLSEEKMESAVSEPGAWVGLLTNIVGPFAEDRIGADRLRNIRIQVANDIDPLIKCMCTDSKRELFQSRKYWFGALSPFVRLIYSLAVTKETIPILANKDGLMNMMLECIFWGCHRTDIINEAEQLKKTEGAEKFLDVMGPDPFSYIADFGGAFLERVLESYKREGENKFYFEGEGEELCMKVGTTPVVSREYNPDCGLIFVSELVGLLKGDSNSPIINNENFLQKSSIHNLITDLVISGCVDKTFIKEVVDLGLNHTFLFEDASYVLKAAQEMNHDFESEGKLCSRDRHVATAVNAGLLDMILKLLLEFGNYPDNQDFMLYVFFNVQAVAGAAMYKHTSKAINSCRSRILTGLQSPEIRLLLQNEVCKVSIEKMQSMFRMCSVSDADTPTGDYNNCNYCARILSASEVRYCQGCKASVYCSRECQVADWKDHKMMCKTDRAKSAKLIKQKVCKLGEKFFGDNIVDVITEATVKGYDILDCVCTVHCTILNKPIVQVQSIDEYFGSDLEGKLRHRSLVENKGEFLGFYFVLNDGFGRHMLGFTGDLTEAQASMRIKNRRQLESFKKSPELKEKCLADIKERYRL